MIKQTARQIAVQTAKQVAQEPLEILKAAREQVSPREPAQPQESPTAKPARNDSQSDAGGEKAKKQAQSQRLMRAYESEIEDIKKQKLFTDLQRRISAGENIALSEYPELSPEQRQVLEAQKQAVAAEKSQTKEAKESPLQIVSKKGRKLFGKIGLKREQTKVEMRQPPSS